MSVNFEELKACGFHRQRQSGYFSIRLKSIGGHLTAEQLGTIQKVAEKFGKGYVHLTTRQGVEIPFIHIGDVDAVKKILSTNFRIGEPVRTITACQGNLVCPHGLIDTKKIADDFERRYCERALPRRFKFGITGCPNNCLKVEENDIGIKGGVKPIWDFERCNFCGACQSVCPEKIIVVDSAATKVLIDESRCIHCGKCIKKCPTNSLHGRIGYIVLIGGENFLSIIFEATELYRAVDEALDFFTTHAQSGERVRDLVERVGRENFFCAGDVS